MTTYFEIPLQPTPTEFEIVLAGTRYTMRTQYRDAPEAGWLLDIDDTNTGEPLAHGIALVTGADLFEQYRYLFDGALVVVPERGEDVPVFNNLGTTVHLLYGVFDAV